jgi:hypothetical protein
MRHREQKKSRSFVKIAHGKGHQVQNVPMYHATTAINSCLLEHVLKLET